MNQQVIRAYIEAYKDHFTEISKMELYKWQAVKQFQDNWNIDAFDFHEMLSESLSKTFNLLDSGQYFPKRMLIQYAKDHPELIRSYFRELYHEENDIKERIENFRTEIKVLNKDYDVSNDYQDHRAVIVYLALKYPDRYYFYKQRMFKSFAQKVDNDYIPIAGRIENVAQYHRLCDFIRYELSLDQELIRLHNQRLTSDCYVDLDLNILTQDFIYAVVRHLQVETIHPPEDKININIQVASAADIGVTTSVVNFHPSTTNHAQNNREKKRIGDLGELFVVQLEREKLVRANKPKLAKKVSHHSKSKGDGLGYDVLSFDVEGNEMYIEVKATKSGKNTPFFITRNELARSIQEKDKFYLYRVYNFNDEKSKGDVFVIQGDASNLCVEVVNYKVKMN